MKPLFKKLALMLILAGAFICQPAKAESTVYFFIDFRFWNPEYVFYVNGEKGFTLNPEGKPINKNSDVLMYNMCMRKVIFKNPDSYVISVDCDSERGTYHAELNLNLEDDETYYVILNANIKNSFYLENLSEKEGLKFLKKAQTSNKYTINEDIVYTGE